MKAVQGCSEEATTVGGEAAPNDHNDKEKSGKNGPIGPANSSRRSFLGKVGGATAVALAAGIPLEPVFEGKHGEAEASVVSYRPRGRTADSFDYRKDTAQDERIDVGVLPDNGDSQR